jgi:hypothetical protein
VVASHKIAALVTFPKRQFSQVFAMRVNLRSVRQPGLNIAPAAAAKNLPNPPVERDALHSASLHFGRASPVA